MKQVFLLLIAMLAIVFMFQTVAVAQPIQTVIINKHIPVNSALDTSSTVGSPYVVGYQQQGPYNRISLHLQSTDTIYVDYIFIEKRALGSSTWVPFDTATVALNKSTGGVGVFDYDIRSTVVDNDPILTDDWMFIVKMHSSGNGCGCVGTYTLSLYKSQ